MDLAWIIFLVMLLAAAGLAWLFNGLVKARNLVSAAWSDIDVQLQRRHDLVPRLVKVVKAYADHEKDTLEAVIAQRDQALRATSVDEISGLEKSLDASIHQLMALAEAYPDLKAGENFAGLSEDLVDIEDHLQYARRFYNGAVRDLNIRVERFPDRLIASPFGFGAAAFFQAESGARGPVDVGAKS